MQCEGIKEAIQRKSEEYRQDREREREGERKKIWREMCKRERITHTHIHTRREREREAVNNTPGLVMIELSMVIFFPSPLSQQKNTISKLSLTLSHTHTHTHTHTPRNYNTKSSFHPNKRNYW